MKEITGTYVNKIGSAIKATNSATCARMALSAGADRASMAGTSWTRKAALSSETSGSTSYIDRLNIRVSDSPTENVEDDMSDPSVC